MAQIILREIAFSRAGDKSNTSTLSLIPYNEDNYDLLKKLVTAEDVKAYFKTICFGKVTRYEIDGLKSLLFVLEEALDGGNTRSLRIDGYGKSLAAYFLSMPVTVPDDCVLR